MKRFVAALGVSALLCGCSKKAEQAPASAQPGSAAKSTFQVDMATAGSISGTVQFAGRRPSPGVIDMSSDPACAAAHVSKMYDDSLVVGKRGQVANAFIYIKSGLEGKTFAVPSTPVTIDQRGCWFHPRVLGLQTGQPLEIINSDSVTHNIHPMAQANREWNHSQGAGDPPMFRKFAHQEIMIPVKCNIHSWMHAAIGVVDNPYFAVSSADGNFSIQNLPPGTYTLGVWHEKLGAMERQVTIAPHKNLTADFEMKLR